MLSLIVKIQNKLYGISSDQVEHIFPCPYIENEKLNYHGDVIKIIDMAVFFKYRLRSEYGINTPLIIVHAKNTFGIIVDEVVSVDLMDGDYWRNEKVESIDLASVFRSKESA